MSDETDEERRRRLEREICYGRVVSALHQKYYRRVDFLLKALGVLGLSGPLLALEGGDQTKAALYSAVFFAVVQVIDWKLTPGELAGAWTALARRYIKLERGSRRLSTDELQDEVLEVADNDLIDVEPLRRIAHVRAAREGGYTEHLPPDELELPVAAYLLDVLFV